MMDVCFYQQVPDESIRFVVLVSRFQGKWVFCKHRQRDTLECPGGHREHGETPEEAARRELFEETGALDYTLYPICAYCVTRREENEGPDTSFGMLYYADITRLGPLPAQFEMERLELFDSQALPDAWTYPMIQPKLLKQVQDYLDNGGWNAADRSHTLQ